MLRLSVTGHREVAMSPRVSEAIRAYLAAMRPIQTWSMLAKGADQAVAVEALRQGMSIAAVIPFPDYEEDFQGEDLIAFRELLARCDEVVRLDGSNRDGDDYAQAGRIIVDRGESVLAIWDGEPAEGRGGTGEIVAYAIGLGRPVDCIDPSVGTLRRIQGPTRR